MHISSHEQASTQGNKAPETLACLAHSQTWRPAKLTHINYPWHKSTASQINSSIKGTTPEEEGSDASAACVLWAKPWHPALKREKMALLRSHRKVSGFRNKSLLQHNKLHCRPHPWLSLQVVSIPWEDQVGWKWREKGGPSSSSCALVSRGETVWGSSRKSSSQGDWMVDAEKHPTNDSWTTIPSFFSQVGERDTCSDHSRELAAQKSFCTDTLPSRTAKLQAPDKQSSALELMVNSIRYPRQEGLLP